MALRSSATSAPSLRVHAFIVESSASSQTKRFSFLIRHPTFAVIDPHAALVFAHCFGLSLGSLEFGTLQVLLDGGDYRVGSFLGGLLLRVGRHFGGVPSSSALATVWLLATAKQNETTDRKPEETCRRTTRGPRGPKPTDGSQSLIPKC